VFYGDPFGGATPVWTGMTNPPPPTFYNCFAIDDHTAGVSQYASGGTAMSLYCGTIDINENATYWLPGTPADACAPLLGTIKRMPPDCTTFSGGLTVYDRTGTNLILSATSGNVTFGSVVTIIDQSNLVATNKTSQGLWVYNSCIWSNSGTVGTNIAGSILGGSQPALVNIFSNTTSSATLTVDGRVFSMANATLIVINNSTNFVFISNARAPGFNGIGLVDTVSNNSYANYYYITSSNSQNAGWRLAHGTLSP
ncbi:MAG: hypothetical protein ACLQDC_01475, partial [Verrucomicrobiia bacterium]